MLGIMSDQAKIDLISARVNTPPIEGSHIGLSTKAIPPTHASVLADYAATELAVAGYDRQGVTGWGLGFLTEDFHARIIAAPIVFHNGESSTPTPLIYSWFWVNEENTQLIMAGMFDNPFVIEPGGSYTTLPFWQLTGEGLG